LHWKKRECLEGLVWKIWKKSLRRYRLKWEGVRDGRTPLHERSVCP